MNDSITPRVYVAHSLQAKAGAVSFKTIAADSFSQSYKFLLTVILLFIIQHVQIRKTIKKENQTKNLF
jgi:hypothetical protein